MDESCFEIDKISSGDLLNLIDAHANNTLRESSRRRPAKARKHSRPEGEKKYVKEERMCLGGCGRKFMSQGIQNRVCARCKPKM